MKTRFFYGGWILTLVATFILVCVNKEANLWPGTVLCVGIFALSSYCLLRNTNFPYRSEALANSWIGPLFLATSEIIFSFNFHRLLPTTTTEVIPSLTAITSSLKQTTLLLVVLIFFGACVKTLLFVWLFFGYGLLHIMALIAEIPVIGKRQDWTKSIKRYQTRWAWIFVIVIFLLSLLPAIFIIWMYFHILKTLR